MISGILLFQNLNHYMEQNYLSILVKRLKSFYIMFIVAIAFHAFLNGLPPLFGIINSLLFLGDLGLGQRFNYGALWFLGVYVFSFMFYIAIFKSFSSSRSLFVIFSIVFISLFSVYTYSPDHVLNRTYEISIGPFQFGLIRGIIGIGLGILLGASFNPLSKIKKHHWLIIEIGAVLIMAKYLFLAPTPQYDFINYIIVAVLLSSISLSHNPLNSFINFIGKKFSYICSLSLPIYIFHSVVIDILKKMDYSANNYSPLLYIVEVIIFAGFIQFCIVLLSKLLKRKS